jgi:hypothetical protein
MREIETHKVHEGDRQPTVWALGKVGVGGIDIPFISLTEPGVTNEALLAVVIDRLEGFQRGEFPCPENALALSGCRLALDSLQKRTRDRLTRGVENKAVA